MSEIPTSLVVKEYLTIKEYEMKKQDKIVIYKAADGQAKIDVRIEKDTVWLSQKQMGGLFTRDYKTISKHINNVFREGELDKGATVAYFATVQTEGGRKVSREIEHYNLDVIISVDTIRNF